MIRYENREHKDAPETTKEWQKTTRMSADARSKRMFWCAAGMEVERDEARREAENWKKWAEDAFCDNTPPPFRKLPWDELR